LIPLKKNDSVLEIKINPSINCCNYVNVKAASIGESQPVNSEGVQKFSVSQSGDNVSSEAVTILKMATWSRGLNGEEHQACNFQ